MAVDTYTATLNNQGRIESRLAFSLAGNGLRGNSSGFTPNFAFPKSLSPSSFHKRTFPEAFAAAPRDESPTAPKEDVEHQITPMEPKDVRSLDSHIIEGGYGSPSSGGNGNLTTSKAGSTGLKFSLKPAIFNPEHPSSETESDTDVELQAIGLPEKSPSMRRPSESLMDLCLRNANPRSNSPDSNSESDSPPLRPPDAAYRSSSRFPAIDQRPKISTIPQVMIDEDEITNTEASRNMALQTSVRSTFSTTKSPSSSGTTSDDKALLSSSIIPQDLPPHNPSNRVLYASSTDGTSTLLPFPSPSPVPPLNAVDSPISMRPTVSRPRASCSSPRPSFTPNDLYSVDRRTPLSSAVSVTEAQLDQVATPHTATEQVEEMPGVEVDSFDVDEFGYPEDHWVDYNGGSGADPPSAPIFSTVASLSRPSSSPSPVPYSSTLPRSESLSLSHTAPTTDDASPNPTSEPLPPSTSSSSPSHGPLPLPPWTNLLPQPFSKSSKKRKRKTTETSLLSSAILASGSTPTIAHVSAEESDAHSSGYPVITYRLRGESGDIVMKEDYMANFIQVSADTKQWEKERSNRKKVKGKKVAWAPDVGFMHDDDSVHIKDEDFDVGLPGERSETQSRSGGHIRNEESHTRRRNPTASTSTATSSKRIDNPRIISSPTDALALSTSDYLAGPYHSLKADRKKQSKKAGKSANPKKTREKKVKEKKVKEEKKPLKKRQMSETEIEARKIKEENDRQWRAAQEAERMQREKEMNELVMLREIYRQFKETQVNTEAGSTASSVVSPPLPKNLDLETQREDAPVPAAHVPSQTGTVDVVTSSSGPSRMSQEALTKRYNLLADIGMYSADATWEFKELGGDLSTFQTPSPQSASSIPQGIT